MSFKDKDIPVNSFESLRGLNEKLEVVEYRTKMVCDLLFYLKKKYLIIFLLNYLCFYLLLFNN